MDFREATDILLAANVTADLIASELGVARNTVLRARMDPSSPNSRPAPHGWQKRLALLARQHSATLDSLADSLEKQP